MIAVYVSSTRSSHQAGDAHRYARHSDGRRGVLRAVTSTLASKQLFVATLARSEWRIATAAAGLCRRPILAGLLACALLIASGHLVARADAQGAAASGAKTPVSAIRLYVLDGGTIVGRNLERYNLWNEPRDLSVAVFLVVHPKGVLLFDTGLGDRYVDGREKPSDPAYTVRRTIASQLAELGYLTTDVTYLAISHMHGDHVGNANNFAGSTWLVQQAERDAMFLARNQGNYITLKDSKTIVLNGDYDVFGDHTVVLQSTPGHTPGHQCLLVTLPTTGAVLLTGDLYHYPEERLYHRFPNFESDLTSSAASRAKIEALVQKARAQMWIHHDVLNYDKLMKSPLYYE